MICILINMCKINDQQNVQLSDHDQSSSQSPTPISEEKVEIRSTL